MGKKAWVIGAVCVVVAGGIVCVTTGPRSSTGRRGYGTSQTKGQAASTTPAAMDSATPRVRDVVAAMPDEGSREEYRKRLEAVQKLGPDLSPDEQVTVYEFLRTRPDKQASLTPLAVNSIKNELLDSLLKQDPLSAELGRELLSLYRDPAIDDVLRDYVVQHFVTYYNRRWPADTPQGDPEQSEILDAYWDAIGKKDKPIAATALIGLMLLTRDRAELDSSPVAAKAMEMATDEKRPAPVRATAIQVCGQMGRGEILPVARREAQSGPTVQFRMASIATLGDLGTAEDVELLADLSAEQEKRIQTAATSALKRLRKRLDTVEK